MNLTPPSFNPEYSAQAKCCSTGAEYYNEDDGPSTYPYNPEYSTPLGAETTFRKKTTLRVKETAQKVKELDKKYHVTRKTKSAASSAAKITKGSMVFIANSAAKTTKGSMSLLRRNGDRRKI